MKVYLIPGLGADKRMYEPQLKIIPDAIIIEHLDPRKGESISAYAKRLVPFINQSEPFTVIGTSLGGMIAIELCRYVRPEKVILIASVKNRRELPPFIRSMKYLNLHKLLPGDFYKKLNKLAARRLDSRGDSPVAGLILQMTEDANPEFISWAIDAVINWQPTHEITQEVFHIHGTNDHLFPSRLIKNFTAIKKGSHVMNLSMSDEVNAVLRQILHI
jgi:pimeloyl-ACP methyl ester carboxylesterase